ncbi:ABC transporter permease [Gemmobacter serpentinus]|uniref:ABC transporter permease n=1 Tax=Gemmobacter serpentinus TaxID=2652247 RepID=UPI001CF71131|nr:ABC transporter permease [Gemmobacter serpentinus]
MADTSLATPVPVPRISRNGLLFALLGGLALWLPLVQFKANRIVAGEGLSLPGALPGGAGWGFVCLVILLLAAGLLYRLPLGWRLGLALIGLAAVILSLGLAAKGLTPEGNRVVRVAPASGFWMLLLAFGLMGTDALSRLHLSRKARWAVLCISLGLIWLCLASGLLNETSVMVEYRARADLFSRSLWQHLTLAFGSLAMALLIGLPLGIMVFLIPKLRRGVLGVLNVLQTIPSLALFGIMIPVFGWIALNVPGAAQIGVAGIGLFPALMALFFYSLLPVVSNTLVGLRTVDPAVHDAAFGLGLTQRQVLFQVQLPLALPVVLAAVRIVLVQNIGLAVIAGLIGGGGFGSFVFQGLNQTAMDLILLGALPTILLALVAGVALDLMVEAISPKKGNVT